MTEINRQEINEIIEIMKTSMNLDKIKECIKALLHLLLPPTTKTSFINRYYYSVGKMVCNSIIENWLSCLNEEVREELLNFFIKEPLCYPLSLLVICEYMKEKSKSEVKNNSLIISKFVSCVLSELLNRNSLKLILIELTESKVNSYIDINVTLQLLKSIPERISNYFLKNVEKNLQKNNYINNLMSGYIDGLIENKIKNNKIIISILRDIDVDGLLIYLKLLNDIYIISLNKMEVKSILIKEFDSYPLNLRMRMFKFICKFSAINYEIFLSLFKDTIENEIEYKSVVNNILLNISLKPKRIEILIKYIKSINQSLILTLIDEILPKWCKEEFIQKSEKSIEKSICIIITKCLESMNKSDLEINNNYNRLLYLMDGIQHLLNYNSEYGKRYGEYMSNKLFKILEKEDKVIECDGFSDDENEREEEDEVNGNDINNNYHYTNAEISKTKSNNNTNKENINSDDSNSEINRLYENPLLIIDPSDYNTNEVYEMLIKDTESDNKEGENDENESDSDDSLESYDLIEKDNKMVGKEKYVNNLRDIIEGLKDDDNLDKRDVSLLSLDKILNSNKLGTVVVGIEKYGLKICIILLNMRNGYFFENFEEVRNRNIMKIITLIPLETVPYLIKEFYSLEKDLEYRIMILKVLSESAKMLCDIKNEESNNNNNNNNNKENDIKRVGRVIKEFKRVEKPKIINNQFLKYSDIYLLPLMNGIDHRNRQIDLLNKDGFLLSKLLYCIGIIYECCYNSIKIMEYNDKLLKIIFVCRYHKDNNVRISVLYLLSRLILVSPKVILESYFINELNELSEWLINVSKNDIDPMCREYSSVILNSGYFLN